MSQVSYIDVEVRPSQGYQTVGFTSRVSFPVPVSPDEAKFESDLVSSELECLALKKIDFLKTKYTDGGMEPTAPQVQSAPAQSNGSMQWAIAYKPKGAGTFDYLPTSVYPTERFIAEAKTKLPELGLPIEEVVVFDDRGGPKGIEAGQEYYCAGKVKARSDSNLAKAMQGKTIVGNIDFNRDGSLRVSLSRDGKAAISGLQIAGQLASMEGTPF